MTQPNTYRMIGRGCCGSVWTDEQDAPSLAIKRCDASEIRSVKEDSDTQQLLLERFKRPNTTVPINIPHWHDFIACKDTEKWAKYKLARFPLPNQVRCDALVTTERLLPFDMNVCSRLIDLYCPGPIKERFQKTATEVHPDCILRLYLGKQHEQARKSQLMSFTLNNLPLWLNRARTLDLDTLGYARMMGNGLALLHWVAKIDADDVEWALGKHALWVIDFDRCRAMELSEAGVRQAVMAFWKNDPYYPRPGRQDWQDQALWDGFKEDFLRTSYEVLAKADHRLADLWVNLVEKEGFRRIKP